MSNKGISPQMILATMVALAVIAGAAIYAPAGQGDDLVKTIGLTIAGLLIYLQSINNGVKADAAATKADVAAGKADVAAVAATETRAQLAVIDSKVNGHLSSITEQLATQTNATAVATADAAFRAGVEAGRKLALTEAAARPVDPLPVVVQEPLPVVVVDTAKL